EDRAAGRRFRSRLGHAGAPAPRGPGNRPGDRIIGTVMVRPSSKITRRRARNAPRDLTMCEAICEIDNERWLWYCSEMRSSLQTCLPAITAVAVFDPQMQTAPAHESPGWLMIRCKKQQKQPAL